MFDDLFKLQKDDMFSVTILDKTYNYKISNILIVLPNETETLKVDRGKKIVTLVTCTPKYINSHRLLIVGSLVE